MLHLALVTFSINDRQSPITEYFMTQFEPFASLAQGENLIWMIEKVYQWMSKDFSAINRAPTPAVSNSIESKEGPIYDTEKRRDSSTTCCSSNPNPMLPIPEQISADADQMTKDCFVLHQDLKNIQCDHCKRLGRIEDGCWSLHSDQKNKYTARMTLYHCDYCNQNDHSDERCKVKAEALQALRL